jgi:hypothetical protein
MPTEDATGRAPSIGSRLRSVDLGQLRALLLMYFRLSLRTAVLIRRRSGPPTNFYGVAALYGSMGAVLSASAFTHPDVLSFSLGLHTITLFVVSMAAIIEANEVLFDRREARIFAALPVDPGTLLCAKSITLVAFTSIPALSLNAIPMFAGLMAKDAEPWFPLVHLVTTLLNVVFACAIVVCVFGVVLRLFGRERFDDLAVWTQVGMGVLYVGYFQIVPRLVRGKDHAATAAAARWFLPTPPGWYAALDAWGAGRTAGLHGAAFAALALAAPLALGWIAIGRLSASYGSGFEDSVDAPPKRTTGLPAPTRPWRSANPLLRLWIRDPLEWAAFRLATMYLRRDRETKLAVYNIVAVVFMFGVLSIVQGREGPFFVPVMLVGFSVLAGLSAMETLEASSQYAAAQLFAFMPIESSAPLFHGVRKCCILLIQIPLTIASLILIATMRPDRDECLQLSLPILVAAPAITLILGAIGSYVPLSKPRRVGDQFARRSYSTLFTILGLFTLIGVGYLARSLGVFWMMLAVEAVLVAVLQAWLRRAIARRPLRLPTGTA